MSQNYVKYSTRDYASVLADLNADPVLAEFPQDLKSAIAGPFDTLNNTINLVANSLFKRMAFSRTVLQDLLSLIDYTLKGKQTSSVVVDITINSAATATGPYTIPTGSLIFSTQGTTNNPAQRFEARSPVTIPQYGTSTSLTVYQQKSVSAPVTLSTATNGSNFQTIDLPEVDILPETLSVSISSAVYTKVTTLVNSTYADKVFKFYSRSDGTSYIKFGGLANDANQYGYIPPAGMFPVVSYATGGGATSNVGSGTIILNIGGDTNILTVTNALAANGGADAETISSAIESSEVTVRSNQGFINESTGKAIMLAIPGVLDGSIVKSGTLTATATVMPNGGGTPSAALLLQVKTALEAAAPLEQITVSAVGPTYLPTSIVGAVNLKTGYTFGDVTSKTDTKPFIYLAILLRSSEIARQAFSAYQTGSVESAVSVINSIWSTFIPFYTFTTADAGQLHRLFQNLTYSVPGVGIYPEDIVTAVEGFVYGVSTFRCSNPGSLVGGAGYVVQISSVTVTQGI